MPYNPICDGLLPFMELKSGHGIFFCIILFRMSGLPMISCEQAVGDMYMRCLQVRYLCVSLQCFPEAGNLPKKEVELAQIFKPLQT